ncbi:MAG: adenylate/guanylate cyclase domain-containing protein [Alphaproteobacteria bacterium]|nr:adenylate/guanylate cyclase domain-containing protein [Alphaproteobacteria bacterium]
MERRLAAILAADVVGYSRLMEADEEGTLARLNALRQQLIDPKIDQNHGRIVKLMGDGMLVEFGSVVDAVRCAVDIQRELGEQEIGAPINARLQLRIGVNLGDIMLQDGDIFGDGVNVAARLQELAEPGSVVISEDVYHQVEMKLRLSYQDLGLQQVKNLSRPIRTYRATIRSESSVIESGWVVQQPGGAKRSWRWAAGIGTGAFLVAGGIIIWLIVDKELFASSSPECFDHLGLPVSCPADEK